MAEAERAEPTGRRRAQVRARTVHAALALLLVLGAGACGASPGAAGTPSAGPPSPESAALTAQDVQDPSTEAAAEGTPSAAREATEPGAPAAATEQSAVRSVVEGFPVDLLPLPDDAMILVTSAVPVGNSEVQEVSLNLRTRATPAEVLDLYRTSLTAAGFTELPADAPHDELAAEATFIRSGGDELVSVGVLDDDGMRSVTIGGRLRAQE